MTSATQHAEKPAPPPRASFLDRIAAFIDNRINPIVTKELRQAVRSAAIQSILGLFLLVQLGTMMVFLLFNDDAATQVNAGREVFLVLQGMLITTLILCVPLYVGIRFAAERTGANVDLLFISTLKPRQIIAGKLCSGMIVSLLIGSTCAPFMTLTYLLRGIDLPTIFIILGLDALLALGAAQLAIFAGSLRLGAFIGAMAGFLALMVAWPMFAIGIFLPSELIRHGSASHMNTLEFWCITGLCLLLGLGIIGLFFSLSVAATTAAAANRALGPRIYVTSIWLVSLLVIWPMRFVPAFGSNDADVMLMIWVSIFVGILLLSLLIGCGEREKHGPRIRRDIPQPPLLRALAFIFFSGSAGGVIWSSIMLAMTLAISFTVALFNTDHDFMDGSFAATSLVAIMLAYVMTATLLRWFFLRHLQPTHSNPVFAIGLIAIGCLGPMLIQYFVGGVGSLDRTSIWLVFNPFLPLMQLNSHSTYHSAFGIQAAIVIVWLIFVSLPAGIWITEQWRGFVRHELTPADRRRESLEKAANAAVAVPMPTESPEKTDKPSETASETP